MDSQEDFQKARSISGCFRLGTVPRAFAGFVLFAVLIASLVCMPTQAGQKSQSAGGESLCYAFLRDSDISTVCQGHREQINLQGRVWDFAISADGSILAAVKEERAPSGEKQPPTPAKETEMVLVSLKSGFKSEIRPQSAPGPKLTLFRTCGTIATFSFIPDTSKVSPYPWPLVLPGIYDVIANKQLNAPGRLSFFRGSSDGRVIAGWAKQETAREIDLVVIVEEKDQRTLPIDLMNESFDVSPNGKYVAYFHVRDGQDHVCIAETTGRTFCSAEPAGSPSAAKKVSVSDSGEVIYDGDLAEDCRGVPCMGIGYWRPGLARPITIERGDSYSAQWITPEVASALHEYSRGVQSRSQ